MLGRGIYIMYMVLTIGNGDMILKPYSIYFNPIACQMDLKDAEKKEHVHMTCLSIQEKEVLFNGKR